MEDRPKKERKSGKASEKAGSTDAQYNQVFAATSGYNTRDENRFHPGKICRLSRDMKDLREVKQQKSLPGVRPKGCF